MLYLRVNEILKEQNKSMYWLSKTTGIAPNHIGKMCNGETRTIRFESLEKICLALNCSIDEMFYSNDPKMQHLLSGGKD